MPFGGKCIISGHIIIQRKVFLTGICVMLAELIY